MRVYLSGDVEGVAGVVDWDQVRGESAAYHEMCRLTTLETNEAIEGALAGGATDVIVNDSHVPMRNLLPELLHPASRPCSSGCCAKTIPPAVSMPRWAANSSASNRLCSRVSR